MKCIILAGGMGDKMWPLSRREYPKQFINIRENRSLLQETVGRNMPLCEEIFIMGNIAHNFIIDGQMEVFQGLKYRTFYEEEPRGTAFPVVMAAFSCNPSEHMYVLNSDHFADGNTYQSEIMKATDFLKSGKMVAFGVQKDKFKSNYHYFFFDNNDRSRLTDVLRFHDESDYIRTKKNRAVRTLVNTGLFLCTAGDFLNDLKKEFPDYYDACRAVHKKLKTTSRNIYISKDDIEDIESYSLEHILYKNVSDKVILEPEFDWSEVASFDIFKEHSLYGYSKNILKENCEDVTIINQDSEKLVVANDLKDMYVVNTGDAIYITTKERADDIKNIVETVVNPYDNQHVNVNEGFFNHGNIIYRPWGYRENLTKDNNYLVKKVVLFPGKAIGIHKHNTRSEQWSVVEGEISVFIDGIESVVTKGDSTSVLPGVKHEIINKGTANAVFIETSIGQETSINEQDIVSVSSEGKQPEAVNKELIKLSPAFKDYLWGGTKLRDVYNKQCDYEKIAESWELSAHQSGSSVVASGRYTGRTFTDYLEKIGKNSLGWKAEGFDRFPILIKFIDAKEDLSIQIHPDDEYALKNEGELGKNEMWYIVDCDEDSYIYWGVNEKITAEELKKKVDDGTILEVLNKVKVKKGDVIFVEAGTIHAIGKGIMICEIQQNSDCTYRLYDYDRRDRYGNHRELHLDKAMSVIDLSLKENLPVRSEETVCDGYTKSILASCKYFQCERYEIEKYAEITMDLSSFKSFIFLDGEGTISDGTNSYEIKPLDSFFMPAADSPVRIDGKCTVLVTRI